MPHAYSAAKRRLVGSPLPSDAAGHERLSKKVGLAVFSSDAVASSAFATQEILHVLLPEAGMAGDTVTVVIPEFVVTRWWENLLHNQSALALKARLLYRRDTVVTSVPFHLDDDV